MPRHFGCIRNVRGLASTDVTKRAGLSGILILLVAVLLSACASSGDEATTGESTSQSSAAVPGEKMSDEGRVTPGAPGSSASVHW